MNVECVLTPGLQYSDSSFTRRSRAAARFASFFQAAAAGGRDRRLDDSLGVRKPDLCACTTYALPKRALKANYSEPGLVLHRLCSAVWFL